MAGVGSGVLRARDIVAGKRVNAYQVNAFFNRHLKNYVNASIEGLKPSSHELSRRGCCGAASRCASRRLRRCVRIRPSAIRLVESLSLMN